MSNDTSERARHDGRRIHMDQDDEVKYWTKRLSVSPEQLQWLVREAGPLVNEIERRLRWMRSSVG